MLKKNDTFATEPTGEENKDCARSERRSKPCGPDGFSDLDVEGDISSQLPLSYVVFKDSFENSMTVHVCQKTYLLRS